VGLWKNIRRGWGEFSRYTKFELRDGSKLDFGMTSVGIMSLRIFSLICIILFA